MAFSRIPKKGNITGADLVMLQGVVCLLRDPNALIGHAERVIAVSYTHLVFSDGGKEWKKVDEIDHVKKIFWNDNRFNIIAFGKIYYSENGKEWTPFELDFDYDPCLLYTSIFPFSIRAIAS